MMYKNVESLGIWHICTVKDMVDRVLQVASFCPTVIVTAEKSSEPVVHYHGRMFYVQEKMLRCMQLDYATEQEADQFMRAVNKHQLENVFLKRMGGF